MFGSQGVGQERLPKSARANGSKASLLLGSERNEKVGCEWVEIGIRR